jgi:hypothetical protein
MRYLPTTWSPGSESIRPYLYERQGWAEKSREKKDKELPGIIKQIKQVQKTIKPSRENEWRTLIEQGKVEKNAKIDAYDPEGVAYNVDHEPDLALCWNGGDNNADDATRRYSVLSDSTLRVVTEEFNLGKKRAKYYLWVGKDFESDLVNSPKDSKVINGRPFLDSENGKPIL